MDAPAAERLHPNDVMRVVRAIEVATFEHEKQKEPAEVPEQTPIPDYSAFALDMPRELLYERINTRVDAMLEQGFMQELKILIDAGYGETAALKSLGYKQMRSHLENAAPLEDCIEEWKRETRRYAKRQGTWFRHQLDVQWMKVQKENGELRSATELAQQIADEFGMGKSSDQVAGR